MTGERRGTNTMPLFMLPAEDLPKDA
jgi:hypothetical protein